MTSQSKYSVGYNELILSAIETAPLQLMAVENIVGNRAFANSIQTNLSIVAKRWLIKKNKTGGYLIQLKVVHKAKELFA